MEHRESNNETAKKIIKKAFFKASLKTKKGGEEDELKDWKPQKISENV
jgi:hypothetical protein